jgi:2-polyprenyl-3-methyl-5-hydroxy-6-metoxy-1,4-benzoquinol methylase
VAIPGDYQFRALTQGFVVQRFWHDRKLDLVRRVLAPEPGARALDVGCGSGVVAHFLAERGASVDAVDCNEEAIRFARGQFARENLRFHLGLANELDFPPESFRHILCLEVVEHLAAGQAADLLASLRRLLAPEGRLLVTTPNYASPWPLIEFAMDRLRLSPRMQRAQHVTRFRLGRLRRVLGEAGLQVQRSGRFCGLAPFASVLSWRLAAWLDRLEWRLGQPLGCVLYAVAGRAS